MIYDIKSVVSKNDIIMLENLINQRNIDVYIVGDGEYTTIVAFKGIYETIYFINYPTVQADNDEYPKMQFITGIKNKPQFKKISNNRALKSVRICRDHVRWKVEENEWNVTIDVGIKLYFDDYQLLILAIDSLGGLIKYYMGEHIQVGLSNEDLNEYWGFKTEELLSGNREELNLHDVK